MNTDPTPRALWAEHALLPGGWAAQVLLRWDASGMLTAVDSGVHTPHQARDAQTHAGSSL